MFDQKNCFYNEKFAAKFHTEGSGSNQRRGNRLNKLSKLLSTSTLISPHTWSKILFDLISRSFALSKYFFLSYFSFKSLCTLLLLLAFDLAKISSTSLCKSMCEHCQSLHCYAHNVSQFSLSSSPSRKNVPSCLRAHSFSKCF